MLSIAFGAGSKRRRADPSEATHTSHEGEHTTTAAEMLGFDPELAIPESLGGLGDTSMDASQSGAGDAHASSNAAAAGSSTSTPSKPPKKRPGGNRRVVETDENGTPVRRKNRDIPDSLRETIISAVLLEGKGRGEVSKKYNLPWSTITSIISAFEKDGSIRRKSRGGGSRKEKELVERHVAFLMELRRDAPDTDVKTAKIALLEAFPELKSADGTGELYLRAIQKVWKEEAVLTLRRVPLIPIKRTEELKLKRQWERQRWAKEVVAGKARGLNLAQAVFVEEAPFHLEGRRPSGGKGGRRKRKAKAAPAEDNDGNDDDDDDADGDEDEGEGNISRDFAAPTPAAPEPLSRNLTVLVAMDLQGFIAAGVVIGPYTEVDVASFLEVDVLPKLEDRRDLSGSGPLVGRHIVMDAELAGTAGSIADLETILGDMGSSNGFPGMGHRLHVLPPGSRSRFSPGKRALLRIPTLFSRRALDEHGSLPAALKAILKREVGPVQCKRWIDETKSAILAVARGEDLDSDSE